MPYLLGLNREKVTRLNVKKHQVKQSKISVILYWTQTRSQLEHLWRFNFLVP